MRLPAARSVALPVRVAVTLLVALALTTGACRTIKNKLGISETVTDPAEGTPEKVIQDVLRAGLEKDPETGWKMFAKLLHSDQRTSAALQQWRAFNYQALRKKVELFIQDRDKVSYAIERVDEEDDGSLTFFLSNSKSDMPTPCNVIQDEKQGGEWKVKRCSL